MKTLVALMALFASLSSAQTQWRKVETLHYDWKEPGVTATLILEVPIGYDGGGEFTRLRILTPGNAEFTLLDGAGLTDFRKDTCSFKKFGLCKKPNLVSSERLFFYRLPSGRSLLFAFGWAYASAPGSFHALALGAKGMPYELLSLKEFDLDDLIDVDGDGNPEVVGKKCFSQEWGDHLLTYDPYSVYRVPRAPSQPARYSLALSEQYNLKHYYGWAGPDCREDVAVVLHPAGGRKPIIVSSKDVEKFQKQK